MNSVAEQRPRGRPLVRFAIKISVILVAFACSLLGNYRTVIVYLLICILLSLLEIVDILEEKKDEPVDQD